MPDGQSVGFWDAAARHVLAIARCGHCGAFSHPPTVLCIPCGSIAPDFRFVPVSGQGRVRSWTIVRQALLPGFEGEIPYLLVDVELDEQAGLRISGRLLDGPDAALSSGARVQMNFEDIADGVSVPAFRLDAA